MATSTNAVSVNQSSSAINLEAATSGIPNSSSERKDSTTKRCNASPAIDSSSSSPEHPSGATPSNLLMGNIAPEINTSSPTRSNTSSNTTSTTITKGSRPDVAGNYASGTIRPPIAEKSLPPSRSLSTIVPPISAPDDETLSPSSSDCFERWHGLVGTIFVILLLLIVAPLIGVGLVIGNAPRWVQVAGPIIAAVGMAAIGVAIVQWRVIRWKNRRRKAREAGIHEQGEEDIADAV
ncbi:hypothetical protein EDC01DRAFT_632547 [Geopyxis carbonaria]|nr:hypothetical protein EDC01DRAFT_632547 [Geopyxis carbonaria]